MDVFIAYTLNMDIIQILDITQVIKNQCQVYNQLECVTPQEINNGMCEDFADDIEHIGFGFAVWGEQIPIKWWSPQIRNLPDWLSHFAIGHCFIMFDDMFDDMFYDSECPQGCEYPDELPFYQRQIKQFYLTQP